MIFNNDFGGMGGFGGNGNGGGYRRGNYIGGGYGGLGAFGGNPLGVPMNVGGYFDGNSLYGGYGSMNMQNVGTYLMLEQLMEQGNHSNSSRVNYNSSNNNSYNNNNNGFNNQNNNGFNNNSGFNNQNNNGFNNNVPNRAVQPSLGPANGNQQGGFGSSQPARNPSAAATTNLPKPKRRRPGVANPGAPLMKGQKIPITGSGRLKIGLGWDVNDSRCDLDASAFMLDKNNRIVGDEWFIFYGQDKSPDSSVQYKVFDISVACEDDAELTIDLNKVSPNVEKILIAITIYEASANRLNFGMVQNVYARIMDADTGKETSRFVQDECYSNVTALVLGELYRYKGAWKFNAVGSGVARDLAEFCAMYGVVME